MSTTEAEQFFYDNGPWAYTPSLQTPEQGHRASARTYAAAERDACAQGYTTAAVITATGFQIHLFDAQNNIVSSIVTDTDTEPSAEDLRVMRAVLTLEELTD
jgi:hypothetical protein